MKRGVGRLVVGVVTPASVACASAAPIQRVDELKGDWTGRRYGPVGNAPATMTVGGNGTYRGVAFLDGGDRAFHGALVVVRPGELRYQGSDGTGSVRVSQDSGRRVLRFLRDDGGVEAVFRQSSAGPSASGAGTAGGRTAETRSR